MTDKLLISQMGALVVALIAWNEAQCTPLYATKSFGGYKSHLEQIDQITGEIIRTFPDHDVLITDLAYDRSTNTLFGAGYSFADGSGSTGRFELYAIDRSTGSYTLLGDNEIEGGQAMYGLAVHPWTFELFGISRAIKKSGNVYKIDKTTGAANLVTTMQSDPIVGTNAAFSPSGTLYAGAGTRRGLYAIDTGTGTVTLTHDLRVGLGMSFDSDGLLYVVTRGEYHDLFLWAVDLTTGETDRIQRYPSNVGDGYSIQFIAPEPAAMTLGLSVLVASIGAVCRRGALPRN